MLEMINQRYMNFLFKISNKPRNISELAKLGDLTISVASTLISRWAREGVVIKQKTEGEKKVIIILTEYGKSQVALLRSLNKNHINNKKQLSEEEREAVSLVDNNIEKEVKNDIK